MVIAVLLLINFNLTRGSYESYQKLTEINKEQLKVKDLELKNSELQKEFQRRESVYFIEQEARNRLGFSRPFDYQTPNPRFYW
jgi:hypothetical protein